MAQLILGGIAVPLHAGAPDVRYDYAGGAADVILAGGRPVRMRHWNKRLITIAGSGWMATGLDALDWDAEHELRCPTPLRISGIGTTLTLTADVRPDEPVTAQAMVNGEWRSAAAAVAGRTVTITPVSGATTYTVVWFPVFNVLCEPPPEGYSGAAVDWQLICREV